MASDKITAIAISTLPDGKEAIQNFIYEIQDLFDDQSQEFDFVGIYFNRREANRITKEHNPNLVFVDLTLSGLRSIDIISDIANLAPDAKIVALMGSDPPHDKPMLALQAGAHGYVSMYSGSKEIFSAINQVMSGNYYLPVQETYDIMRQAAPELLISAKERRTNIIDGILTLIPVAGILAAFTSYMWRSYWGQVGIRVSDLGVDASSRITDLIVIVVLIIAIIGPLFFVGRWIELLDDLLRKRVARAQGNKSDVDKKSHALSIASNRAVYGLSATIIIALYWLLIYLLTEYRAGGFIFVLGIGVSFLLIAHLMRSTEFLPAWLCISKERIRSALMTFGCAVLTLFIVMIVEVRQGPDLREDGVHGLVAPKVLGLSARPATITDLDGKRDPISALYVGGNADLYVLYDPCEKVVRLVPVGSSRVKMIDRVEC